MNSDRNRNNALAIGTVVHGPQHDYRVVSVLGQGGFGITYLVETSIKVGNIEVPCRFAMKEHFIGSLCERDGNTQEIIFSAPVADEVKQSLKAFVREAERIKEFGASHANIVNVNELFQANGTAYYIMEYLEGDTLLEYIKRVGPITYEETISILRPVIEAVAFLHKNKLTHYDIKPANIILSRKSDGKVVPVLIDFGLSKHYSSDGEATSTLLQAGYSVGYSSLEQYAGLTSFTPEADVYSLAATIYFCLTGKAPKEPFSDPAETLEDDLGDKVPHGSLNALKHALAMKASSRTADASQLLSELTSSSQPDEKEKDTIRIDTIKIPVQPKKIEAENKPFWKDYPFWTVLAFCAIIALVFLFTSKTGSPEYEYVDMGLPSGNKWATTNVGAAYPEDYGDYFSWGETETKPEYASSVAWGQNFGEIAGDKTKDAATANWGEKWITPSKADFEELLNNCDAHWITQNGKEGVKFTSRVNGNSIFLPAAGYKFFERWALRSGSDKILDYWSSTQKDGAQAYTYGATTGSQPRKVLNSDHIPYGRSIRPILKP